MNDIEDPLGEAEKPQSVTLTRLTSTSRTRCTCTNTSAILIMVLGVPAGERPRRPTSPATSGGERQHHTAGVHLHARPTSSTSTIWKTSHLHHPYTAIESTTGLCTAALTSKKGYTPHQAAQLHRWIVKHGFTKSILQSDAETSLMQLVNTSLYRPQLTYKSVTSLLTSESRKGGEIPSEPL